MLDCKYFEILRKRGYDPDPLVKNEYVCEIMAF
jgi:hypothetical protein